MSHVACLVSHIAWKKFPVRREVYSMFDPLHRQSSECYSLLLRAASVSQSYFANIEFEQIHINLAVQHSFSSIEVRVNYSYKE